jgi:adenosylcobinamide-phosphate synthase
VYGIFLTLFGAAIFALPVVWLASLRFPIPWIAVLIQGLLLKAVFSLRGLLRSGNKVEQALRAGDLIEARRLVGWHLVSRKTDGLSSGQVASAAIESLAENLGDSIMAPWLAFAVGGAPLAWAYRFVNTADAMIGYHDPAHEYLGKFAAKLDDVLRCWPSMTAQAARMPGGQ